MLGQAGTFAVLGLTGADWSIGTAATTITGNVGLGPLDTGVLEKATINGKLILDPTETAVIHPDLVVTCGTFTQDLSGAVADAQTASTFLAAKVPTQTFVDITTSTTITRTAAENVISVHTIDLLNQNLTLVGNATDTFILNLTGDFSCRGTCQINLSGGLTYLNVIFNILGPEPPGATVFIKDPSVVANGIFLATQRSVVLDKATLNGAIIGGGFAGASITVHSGAQLVFCPPCPACAPAAPFALRVVVSPDAGGSQAQLGSLRLVLRQSLASLGLPGRDVTLTLTGGDGDFFRATIPAAQLVPNALMTSLRFRDPTASVANGIRRLLIRRATGTMVSVRGGNLTLGPTAVGPFTVRIDIGDFSVTTTGKLRVVGTKLLSP